MTVVKVWGRMNNGYEVDFTHVSSTMWNATIPDESPSGYYIVECWAEDDAGNIGYMIAKVWVVDGKLSCIQWVEDPWGIKFINESISLVVQCDGFSMRHIVDDTSLLYIPTTYSLHYICPCEGVSQ